MNSIKCFNVGVLSPLLPGTNDSEWSRDTRKDWTHYTCVHVCVSVRACPSYVYVCVWVCLCAYVCVLGKLGLCVHDN